MSGKGFSNPDVQKKIRATVKERYGINCVLQLPAIIRNELKLDELGFAAEQRIGRRWVDDLNEEKKIIVEFNGDYTHANPKLHNANDVIRLRGQSFTASTKWEADERKILELERLGYRVVVVWESDDLDVHRKRLKILLGED